MDKTVPTLADAMADIPDGAVVMIDGLGGSGAPIELIHALVDNRPQGCAGSGRGDRLMHGAKRVAVITDHVTREGQPKLLERCTLPLTGVGCVTRVHTSHAVIDIDAGHFLLREKLADLPFESLQAMTGARLHLDGPVGDLIVPEL